MGFRSNNLNHGKSTQTSLFRGFPLSDNRLPQSLRWLSDENDLQIGWEADIIYFLYVRLKSR